MSYKNINQKDIADYKKEVQNAPIESIKLWLSYINMFKNIKHNLTEQELKLQSEYRKILIGELVSRGKRKNK